MAGSFNYHGVVDYGLFFFFFFFFFLVFFFFFFFFFAFLGFHLFFVF